MLPTARIQSIPYFEEQEHQGLGGVFTNVLQDPGRWIKASIPQQMRSQEDMQQVLFVDFGVFIGRQAVSGV